MVTATYMPPWSTPCPIARPETPSEGSHRPCLSHFHGQLPAGRPTPPGEPSAPSGPVSTLVLSALSYSRPAAASPPGDEPGLASASPVVVPAAMRVEHCPAASRPR